MATKKKVTKEVNAAEAEKKAAKRKARLEAIKNRPEGQRPNGKQIDVIETGNGVVKNYGYPEGLKLELNRNDMNSTGISVLLLTPLDFL